MDLLWVDPDLQKSDGFAQEVHTVIKHAQKGMDRSIKKNQDSEQDAIDDLPQVQKLADILAINIYSEENYQKGIRAVLMIRRSVLYKMEVTKIS